MRLGKTAAGLAGSADGESARPALELRGVTAAYERVEVLSGVDITVPPGQVFALLGPNGAGKTTTLRVASGRLRPVSGSVLVDGRDVTGISPERLARRGVCSVPEGRGVFPSLTVAENLRMWTYRGGLSRAEVEETAYQRFPRLAERRRQLAGTLSGGEQQMLAMSRALSTHPKLLLLDEISMGLAPVIVSQLYEVVGQIAAEGFAIVVVEQFAQMALSVARRAAVMTQGRIELEGSPDEVGEAVKDIYLRTGSAGRAGNTDRAGRTQQ
jgi:branched-chain amino acid transport system ATP-binding protein